VDELPLSTVRKIEMADEHVARILVARIAIAVRPPLLVTVAHVIVGLVLVRARTAADVRTGVIVAIATTIIVPAAFVVLIAWVLAPSSVKHAAPPKSRRGLQRVLPCVRGYC
jgi:hypothetical protein